MVEFCCRRIEIGPCEQCSRFVRVFSQLLSRDPSGGESSGEHASRVCSRGPCPERELRCELASPTVALSATHSPRSASVKHGWGVSNIRRNRAKVGRNRAWPTMVACGPKPIKLGPRSAWCRPTNLVVRIKIRPSGHVWPKSGQILVELDRAWTGSDRGRSAQNRTKTTRCRRSLSGVWRISVRFRPGLLICWTDQNGGARQSAVEGRPTRWPNWVAKSDCCLTENLNTSTVAADWSHRSALRRGHPLNLGPNSVSSSTLYSPPLTPVASTPTLALAKHTSTQEGR